MWRVRAGLLHTFNQFVIAVEFSWNALIERCLLRCILMEMWMTSWVCWCLPIFLDYSQENVFLQTMAFKIKVPLPYKIKVSHVFSLNDPKGKSRCCFVEGTSEPFFQGWTTRSNLERSSRPAFSSHVDEHQRPDGGKCSSLRKEKSRRREGATLSLLFNRFVSHRLCSSEGVSRLIWINTIVSLEEGPQDKDTFAWWGLYLT